MSTAVLEQLKPGEIRVFTAPTVRGTYSIAVNENGTAMVTGLEVFRAGTFRDSMGDQMTWTEAHLDMMVAHFALLRDNGSFPDVPFRSDHSFSVDKVVGYFEGLARVGDKLTADVLLTEPTAVEKFNRGTYRSRSLEVGMYVTNDEAPYFPVVMGCAFVDIPAVEGLHRNGQSVKAFNFSSTSQVPQEAIVPDPVVPAPAPAPHAFRIGDSTVTDYAAVQAHIDSQGRLILDLNAKVAASDDFAKGVKLLDRKAFVAKLAADNKIGQPQVEGLEALVTAESFDDAAFDAFKKAYENAPVLSILGNHGGGSGDPNTPPSSPASERADRIAVLEGIVAGHRHSQMSEDKIVKTNSYQELQKLLAAAS